MKVVHVAPSLSPLWGGTTTAILDMARGQSIAGADVVVLATFQADDYAGSAARLAAAGVTLYVAGPTHGPLQWVGGLRSTVHQACAGASVVHVHGVWESIQYLGAQHALAAGIPFVLSPHGMLTTWSLQNKRWRKACYRQYRLNNIIRQAVIIHCTTAHEAQGTRLRDIRSTPPIVEPLGIDLDAFLSERASGGFRRKYPRLQGCRFALFLSRLHPSKGLSLLLEAFSITADRTAGLVLAGPCDAVYRDTLNRQVRYYGLQHRVVFTGMLPLYDKVLAYRDADVFVLPSHHDSFGIVVVEALGSGLPVIVSRHVGLAGAIEHHNLGTVVEMTPISLAAALDSHFGSARSEFERSRLREYAIGQYDFRGAGRRWLGHYARVVDNASEIAAKTDVPGGVR